MEDCLLAWEGWWHIRRYSFLENVVALKRAVCFDVVILDGALIHSAMSSIADLVRMNTASPKSSL